MARFRVRRKQQSVRRTDCPTNRRADAGGPYIWQHVIQLPEGLAFASIYRKQGDDLTTEEALELRRHCARAKYDVRRVRS